MATAIAHPNIALVKYWGKRDEHLNLPSTSSLSLTVAPFHTRTEVRWDTRRDRFIFEGREVTGLAADRVFEHLDRIDPWRPPAEVYSQSNFPTAAGLASSASAFAALTLAGCTAAGQQRTMREMSLLARQGSGSACRSFWGGMVEWQKGERSDGSDSHGAPIPEAEGWDLAMVAVVLSQAKKSVSSRAGMKRSALTSPMYPAWVESADQDLLDARQAIRARDLDALGVVMERSALKMHATMMTSQPGLRYWKSGSVWAMDVVESLRSQGVSAWWTMDAGPNVKILCRREDANLIAQRMERVAPAVHVLQIGGAPRLLPE